jgi:hypothetical protein
MRIDVVSLFPEFVGQISAHGVVGRAQERGLVSIHGWNPRDYASGNYRRVDERPFGGGPGMVMLIDPRRDCLRAARSKEFRATKPFGAIAIVHAGKHRDQALGRLAPARALEFTFASLRVAQEPWLVAEDRGRGIGERLELQLPANAERTMHPAQQDHSLRSGARGVHASAGRGFARPRRSGGSGRLRASLGLLDQVSDLVGHLRALSDPVLHALGIELDALLGAGGDRVVETHALDVAAVARAAAVGDDDVVEGALLGATARQADLDHVLQFPCCPAAEVAG